MKTHNITEQEYMQVIERSKLNKLKRIDKRLQVIILRYEGMKDKDIADKLGYSRKRISQLCADFKCQGLDEYARHKYGGNNQAVEVAKEIPTSRSSPR
jgi:transposase